MKRPLVTTLIAALAVSAGAAPPARGQEAAPVEVIFTSERADSGVQVGAPNLSPAGPLMRLVVTLTNTTRKPLKLEYSVDWFDQAGAPLPGLTAWKTVFLDPNQSEALTAMSNRPGAASAKIVLRDVGAS